MSKSVGNVIAPKQIIEKYGIDTLRWWTAAHATQHAAIPVSHQMLQNSMDNLQKIRNTLRFFSGFVGNKINDDLNFNLDNLQMLDKYFLNSLILFEKDIYELYKSYQYNRVTAAILHWIVNIASGIYFNLIKDRLYCGTDEQCNDIKNVLRAAFYILNKTLWPIAPFLIEECWSYYGCSNTKDNCVPYYKSIPLNIPSNWIDTDAQQLIEKCIQLRSSLHQSLTKITPWTIDLVIECNNDVLKDLQLMHPKISEKLNDSELCEILQVNSINLILNENLDNYRLHTSLSNEIRCARCRRYTVSDSTSLCNRCEVVLEAKFK